MNFAMSWAVFSIVLFSEDVIDYSNKLMRDAGVPDPDYANMPDEMAENARNQLRTIETHKNL